MHFAIANQEEGQVNAGLFNAVEEILRTRTQLAEEVKLRELRRLFERTVQKARRANQE
jgi:hypothetical protein